jgi:hypothetical protein
MEPFLAVRRPHACLRAAIFQVFMTLRIVQLERGIISYFGFGGVMVTTSYLIATGAFLFASRTVLSKLSSFVKAVRPSQGSTLPAGAGMLSGTSRMVSADALMAPVGRVYPQPPKQGSPRASSAKGVSLLETTMTILSDLERFVVLSSLAFIVAAVVGILSGFRNLWLGVLAIVGTMASRFVLIFGLYWVSWPRLPLAARLS